MADAMSSAPNDLVVLLDVDDTLLDNDRFGADLNAHLERSFGAAERDRYWSIYNELRMEEGFADYLGAMQKFRVGLDDDAELLELASFALDYPFASLLYPRALDTIAHLRTFSWPTVLSDGDIVVQPRKVERSGISKAVEGRVLIYLHKERMLDSMQRRFPAAHYVMVDDKVVLLAAMKQKLRGKLTTVFVRQGHYAAETVTANPPPDLVIDHIADMMTFDATQLRAASR